MSWNQAAHENEGSVQGIARGGGNLPQLRAIAANRPERGEVPLLGGSRKHDALGIRPHAGSAAAVHELLLLAAVLCFSSDPDLNAYGVEVSPNNPLSIGAPGCDPVASVFCDNRLPFDPVESGNKDLLPGKGLSKNRR